MMCSFRKPQYQNVSACKAFSTTTMIFSCFFYHFRSSYQTLDDTIIAQSFLEVLVIDLSMFLVVKTEV